MTSQMNDRDRLAADLRLAMADLLPPDWHLQGDDLRLADRLIALGWVKSAEPTVHQTINLTAPLDEERLARALDGTVVWAGPPVVIDRESSAAAIAKAYREDGDGG